MSEYDDICNDIAEQTYRATVREIEEVYGNEKRELNKLVEQLKAENERLRQESLNGVELAQIATILARTRSDNLALVDRIAALKDDKKELQEALRKCSPYDDGMCMYCGMVRSQKHTDDCEYVRLIGGAE